MYLFHGAHFFIVVNCSENYRAAAAQKSLMTNKIRSLWNFIWNARPLGQSLILALVVMAFSSTVTIFLIPTVGGLAVTVHQIPEAYEGGARASIVDGELIGDDFPGCRWSLPTNASQINLVGPPTPWRVLCDESAAAQIIDTEYPIRVLSERFSSDPGWEIGAKIYSAGLADQRPLITHITYLGILGIVAAWLLRNIEFSADLYRARKAIFRQPWVLILGPVAMFGGTAVFTRLPSFDPNLPGDITDLFKATAPGALGLVTVVPLFEEAVFRQWLYVRTIARLPVWAVAFGSAWFFMLMHLFNPQAQAMPGYLPTVFLGGLVFFWIRHRFDSFSLAALAHMLTNGLALAVARMIHT